MGKKSFLSSFIALAVFHLQVAINVFYGSTSANMLLTLELNNREALLFSACEYKKRK